MAAEGIGGLAIDLRGHGESPGSPQDYAGMVQDVRAARRFLSTRSEVAPSRIGIAGASIGATLAALASADDPSVVSLALLSPSLDYRGPAPRRRRSRSTARARPCSSPATTTGIHCATVRELREGGRRSSRGRHPRARRSRDGDAGGRARSRPPPAGVVPTNAAMIEDRSFQIPGERSTSVKRFSHLRRRRRVLRHPRRLDHRQPAGRGTAPGGSARGGARRRHPVRSTAAPLDESRAATLANAAEKNPRDVQRAPRARQPLLRLGAIRGCRALVRAGARDRARQRQREHRPRHQLLLHEPAGPGAAAVRSLARHRPAPHQDAPQRRHRPSLRQRRSRRSRAGLAARRRVRAGFARGKAREAGAR